MTFDGVTAQVFLLVIDQLRTDADVTERDAGLITMQTEFLIVGIYTGIRAVAIHWNYDNSVSVKIEYKPFYITEGMIESSIRDAITTAQQAVARSQQ